MKDVTLTPEIMTEIQLRVQKIFMTLFELSQERLTPEVNLYTGLGLDSIDAIDLVVCFEQEFKMQPTNDDMKAIRTMSDVYELIYRYVSQKQTAAPPAEATTLM